MKAALGTASIMLCSSVYVTQDFAAHTSVPVAKGAVEEPTRTLATEMAPITRVNAIATSQTDTPLASGLTGNSQMAASIAQMHALKRIRQPSDTAAISAFLIPDHTDWTSGQMIGMDGWRWRLRVSG